MIDIFTATLGGDTIVKTMYGKIKVKIPAGTQYGKTLRIKGKGMPVYDQMNQFGDLLVEIHFTVPKKLTQNQKDLLEQLKISFT